MPACLPPGVLKISQSLLLALGPSALPGQPPASSLLAQGHPAEVGSDGAELSLNLVKLGSWWGRAAPGWVAAEPLALLPRVASVRSQQLQVLQGGFGGCCLTPALGTHEATLLCAGLWCSKFLPGSEAFVVRHQTPAAPARSLGLF